MGRGRSFYLSYVAFVLFSTASRTTANDLFEVDIWNGPAPSPQEGPPFSANASRNLAILPYQIIGIVGAYVGSVLIILTLLLTTGRRLRKRAQSMAAQPKEMVKPLSKTFERSPSSPNSSRHWYSPRKLREKKSASSSIRSGTSNQLSPGMDSVVSFDHHVVEADRMRRQEEMERLYAAVMAQDDRRNASQPNVATSEIMPVGAPPEYSRKNPPRLNPPRLITDDPSLRHLQAQAGGSGPVSPGTPKSPVRAIYPPGSSIPTGPSSPTSPIRAEYPPFPPQQASQPDLRTTRENPSGSFGNGQTGSTNTTAPQQQPKKIRKSLRNIKISGPILKDDNSDGAHTPLSPRYYTDPGIPPEPPTGGTGHSARFPDTPGTGKSYNGRYPGEEEQEHLDEVRDLPQANPQRLSTHMYNNQPQLVTNAASTRPDPTKTTGTATGTGTLPFREMNRQYAQANYSYPQRSPTSQSAFPLSPGHWNGATNTAYATSAGPVKTTFIEARRDKLSAPRTGMATPYSPYMPFTPLTPVTPHLTSRAERKQRLKEETRIKGAITEEDAVADESDLWSSGY